MLAFLWKGFSVSIKVPLFRIKLGCKSPSDGSGGAFAPWNCPPSSLGAALQARWYYSSRAVLLAGCSDCLGNTFLPFRLTQNKLCPTPEAREQTVVRGTFVLFFFFPLVIADFRPHEFKRQTLNVTSRVFLSRMR